MPADPIVVEVLHTPGWGRWDAARDAVVRVAEEHDLAISLTVTTVISDEEAEALRFPGSPTVRVRGHDLQPEVDGLGDFGLG